MNHLDASQAIRADNWLRRTWRWSVLASPNLVFSTVIAGEDATAIFYACAVCACGTLVVCARKRRLDPRTHRAAATLAAVEVAGALLAFIAGFTLLGFWLLAAAVLVPLCLLPGIYGERLLRRAGKAGAYYREWFELAAAARGRARTSFRKAPFRVLFWRAVSAAIVLVMIAMVVASPPVAGALLLFALGARLAWKRSHRVSLLSRSEVRSRDPRPHVLFLREFEADALAIHTPLFLTGRLTHRHFTQVVADAAWPLGPVVGMTQPGRRLGPDGVSPDTAPHHEWKQRVSNAIPTSAIVLLVVGASEGVAWEFDALEKSLDRTVLVMPPLRGSRLRNTWAAFLANCAHPRLRRELQGVDAPRTVALVVEKGYEVTAVVPRKRKTQQYDVALKVALMHRWHTMQAAAAGSPSAVPEASASTS